MNILNNQELEKFWYEGICPILHSKFNSLALDYAQYIKVKKIYESVKHLDPIVQSKELSIKFSEAGVSNKCKNLIKFVNPLNADAVGNPFSGDYSIFMMTPKSREVFESFGEMIESPIPSRSAKAKEIKKIFVDKSYEKFLQSIVELNLKNYSLKSIPMQINCFKSLKTLNLNSMELESIVNFDLPNLINLNLSRNNLQTVPNFANLKKLQRLFLEENQLKGRLPNFNLPELEFLDASKNQIVVVPEFSKLKNLIDLNLSDNKIKLIFLKSKELISLENLDLSNNGISFFNKFEFKVLNYLVLYGNPLREVGSKGDNDANKFPNEKIKIQLDKN